MDCACRCDRAVRLVRAVRDFDSCTADKLHVVLLQPHSLSTKASRDAGPVFLNTTPHEKAARATLRPPSAAQTAPFHSKPRLEAALHPPFWYLNSDTI